MRIALYARYSSDNQRAASIDDQLALCRAFAAMKGWQIVREFSDAAQSGASMFRAGFQGLLQFAVRRECDAVVAESLDRFSRNLRDIADVFERLTFSDVQLVTVSEGEITDLHVGLKGTMNALYLKDLGEKTHRGQHGRVLAGKSAGGLCYGYRPVPGSLGERVIDPVQADIVRRVFHSYADGQSPKSMAKQFNAEGIAPPRGRDWHPSAINGNVQRGTGLLNNELYIGRLVWNRLEYRKDPASKRRVSRLNPRSEWVTIPVPELRIVDEALWQTVKERQRALIALVHRTAAVRARRPAYLFSGLIRCALCGSGYCVYNRDRLACTGARDRGTCENRQTIKREEVETRVLAALQDKLFTSDAFDYLSAKVQKLLQATRSRQRAEAADAEHRRAKLDRQIANLTAVLEDGMSSQAVRSRLMALEQERDALPTAAPAVLPLPHPNLAEHYIRKVRDLRAALTQPASQAAAAARLREFIAGIVLSPGAPMGIELQGNGALVLQAAGWQAKVVAGARTGHDLPAWTVAA